MAISNENISFLQMKKKLKYSGKKIENHRNDPIKNYSTKINFKLKITFN